MSFTAPTLLTLRDCPMAFEALLPAWFSMRSELSEVLTLLNAPYYAPFMFSEHRFSSIFQSAEALARHHGFSREMSKHDHQIRVDAIVSAAERCGPGERRVGKTHLVGKK